VGIARVEEFRRRLREARLRLARTVAATDEELETLDERQPGAPLEDAPVQAVVGVLSQLEGREKQELDEIDAAQARLEAGTFGVCEACAQPIALTRLRALPSARLCARCQGRQETRAGARVQGLVPGKATTTAERTSMARRKAKITGAGAPKLARSPKAGSPPREITSSPRVRRRQKSVHTAVRKDTTLFETDHGPRAAWPASTSKRKKR
jgi:RNA polymerase-binding transcription factor DksA